MSQNRQYELVYIVSPDASEQAIADLHTQIEQIVQRFHGTLEKTENWGRRKLAYEIGRHKEGTYVLEVIVGGGELMKEIDRRLKVSDLNGNPREAEVSLAAVDESVYSFGEDSVGSLAQYFGAARPERAAAVKCRARAQPDQRNLPRTNARRRVQRDDFTALAGEMVRTVSATQADGTYRLMLPPGTYHLPFTTFRPRLGASIVDFTSVGAITLTLRGTNASVDVDSIDTVVMPPASLLGTARRLAGIKVRELDEKKAIEDLLTSVMRLRQRVEDLRKRDSYRATHTGSETPASGPGPGDAPPF